MKRLSLTKNQRSQLGYIYFSAFSYIPMLLVGGTFLVDLLQDVGFTGGAIGVIASIGHFMAIAYLLVLFFGQKIRSPKKVCIAGYSTGLIVLGIAYVVALLPLNQSLQQVLIVACLVLSLFMRITVGPTFAQWRFTFVPVQERGRFTATNTLVSLIFSVVITPLLGYMRDYFFSVDKMDLNFTIIAILILVMDSITIVSMLMIQDASIVAPEQKKLDLKDVFAHTLQNKSFCGIMLFYIIWIICLGISTGFWDVYKIGNLGFNVTTVQIIGIVTNVLLIVSLRPLGRLADKFSFLWCMRLGLLVAAVVFGLGIFTTPATAWMSIVYTILYCFPSFAIGSNFDNLLMDYIDSSYFPYAFAICHAIGGLLAFGASIFSGALLDHIQAQGNTLFGYPVYAQQVQAALSFAGIVVLYILATFVLNKIPKVQQTAQNQ